MTRAAAAERLRSARLRMWTRKLHNYLGLHFLLFIWLFAISGLVLNHSQWSAGQFWKSRQETTTQRAILRPTVHGDVAIAAELMKQLGIVGEIGDTKRDAEGRVFDFQIVKPGQVFRVEARLDSAFAKVTEIRLNAWGVLDVLHKFTGVRMDAPAQSRDWILTRIWSFAMDALAVGLVVLVCSGLYLWYRLPAKRATGLAALVVGVACCAFFLYGWGTGMT